MQASQLKAFSTGNPRHKGDVLCPRASQTRPSILSSRFNSPTPFTHSPISPAPIPVSSHTVRAYDGASADVQSAGPTVLWFKNDLRVDDHPGLLEAVKTGGSVIPVYCLDCKLASTVLGNPGGAELLHGGVCNLKRDLKGLGSDLVVRVGNAAEEVLGLAQEVGASRIITEDEIDFRWLSELQSVQEGAERLRISTQTWSASLWDEACYDQNYGTFKELREIPLQPVESPGELSPLPFDIGSEDLPDISGLSAKLQASRSEMLGLTGKRADPFWRNGNEAWRVLAGDLTAGNGSAIKVLRDYVSLEGPNSNGIESPLTELVAEVEEESLLGLSFPAIFFSALSLGILSPRRVYKEALESRNGASGFVEALFGGSGTFGARAAMIETEAADFHKELAKKSIDCEEDDELSGERMFWNWYGLVGEYTVAKPTNPREGAPPIVLVHGFGASCFHWRRNVDDLCAAGYTVYCPTLPGYGRSQKPLMKYSQFVWGEYIKDFIVHVVNNPVVIAGNSIGGYVSASVAAYHKSLIRGVVLLNSAGPIDPEYVAEATEAPRSDPPPKFVVDLVAQGLLKYLEMSAGGTLKRLYPTNPENADGPLAEDILRAGKDPNAVSVLKSVFFLQKPAPLNYLLSEMWGGPVLVLQGRKDPLNDAEGRANDLKAVCSNVEVKLLEAGHCPHDEVPSLVNSGIVDFMEKCMDAKLQREMSMTA